MLLAAAMSAPGSIGTFSKPICGTLVVAVVPVEEEGEAAVDELLEEELPLDPQPANKAAHASSRAEAEVVQRRIGRQR
ncbi:MAG: hypothetical protein ACYC91_08375 [Solirubrobacteraceae bacterium]